MARLYIDEGACQGHGLCYGEWPELFDAREDGTAVPLVEEIDDSQLVDARDAALTCPEQAIQVLD